MKALLLPALVLTALCLTACPFHSSDPTDVEQTGGEQPWYQHVAEELERIPAEQTADAVFDQFRKSYERDPELWGEGAVERMLDFEPADEGQAQAFLGFVCYLTGKGDKRCELYLYKVMIAMPNAGPYPLHMMTMNPKLPIGEFFDHWTITALERDYYERMMISIERKQD
ncbi:MAG: hypothetical protein KDB90_06860 [Planctomycetes bacterium]|nr:hypothetical protein [Planctomycetota bacterium]